MGWARVIVVSKERQMAIQSYDAIREREIGRGRMEIGAIPIWK